MISIIFQLYFAGIHSVILQLTSDACRLKTCKSSVIRQKSESQNGCFKKTKHVKFSEKRTFLPPDKHMYGCVSRGKKCSFFGKFEVLCVLESSVLRFTLLPYYRQNNAYIFTLLTQAQACSEEWLYRKLQKISTIFTHFSHKAWVCHAKRWFIMSIICL